jgi:hypothetical protein
VKNSVNTNGEKTMVSNVKEVGDTTTRKEPRHGDLDFSRKIVDAKLNLLRKYNHGVYDVHGGVRNSDIEQEIQSMIGSEYTTKSNKGTEGSFLFVICYKQEDQEVYSDEISFM